MAGALALVYLAGLVHLLAGASPLALAAGLLLGGLGADLLTALVHWACDTWGSEETPWLGAGLIKGFREHHVDPQEMVRHDWIEVNGEAALAAAAGFGLLSPLAWQLASGGQVFWYAGLCSLICVAAAANQLHKWAHVESPPALARALQRLGAILSPASHAEHHRGPHTSRYCISTGWLNGTLDTIRFWRGLERCVEAITGAEARDGSEKHEAR
jgi:ubiquitin-conjugating enzyme E2 variant